jgi:glycyl-tRNA synthetase
MLKQVRSDELGLPFIVTVDFETVDKTKCKSENRFDTVTVRERDSAKQIRVKCDEVANLIFDLVMGRVQWSECLSKYINEN